MKQPNSDVGHVGIDALYDDNGDLRVGYKNLTAEDMEVLQTLNQSPYWKFYRDLLIKAKEAYFNSTLAMKDPNEMVKNVGFVAGVNFAINQLPVIVGHHQMVVRKKQAEAVKKEKARTDFKRG